DPLDERPRRAENEAPAESFDHLVGDREHARRNVETKRLGGLEIDDELELGRLNDRKVAHLASLEDARNIGAGLSVAVREACAVAHQATVPHECLLLVDGWEGMLCSQRHDVVAAAVEEWIGAYDEGAGTRPNDRRKGCRELALVASAHDFDLL